MKKTRLFVLVLCAFMVFSIVSCNDDPNKNPKTGSIAGRAFYQSAASHDGILISVELSDGLKTESSVIASTRTRVDGQYELNDLAPGNYTVYASSKDSKEKAVATNVLVSAGSRAIAADLGLTPTGSISGRILIDGKDTGNRGFVVFVEGTSYLAVTDDIGLFRIEDVPSGLTYKVFAQKENFMGVLGTASVVGSRDTSIASYSVNSNSLNSFHCLSWLGSYEGHPSSTTLYAAYYNTTDGNSYIYDGESWVMLSSKGAVGEKGPAGLDGKSIVWKGSLAEHPTDAEELWAYYNTKDGNSYIYDGESWVMLSSKGAVGEKGPAGLDGKSIVWKGSLAEHPTEAEELWAYYNTTDGNAYIYAKGQWNLLIENVSVNYDVPTIIGAISSSDAYDMSSVYIKVVDDSTNYTVWNDRPAPDGDFVISGLDGSHSYTLYFSSEKLPNTNISYGARALAADNTSTTLGAILERVVPLSGKPKDVGEVSLTPNGTVMGKVTLKNKLDSSDIDVYLEGTSYATKTDRDGCFVISDVIQGAYTACFMRDGYETEKKYVIVYNSDSSVYPIVNVPAFSLVSSCGSISGVVTVNDSGSPADVEVKAINKDGNHAYTVKTDSEGRYSIPNAFFGDYTLTFAKSGYETYSKTDLTVESDVEAVVNHRLNSLVGGLKINIGYSDKSDSTGIVVNVYRDNILIFSTTTTSTGVVIIADLKVGTGYSVVASSEGYGSSGETNVAVESGKVSQVSLARLSNKYGLISGSVHDSYGDPVGGATVLLKSDGGSSYSITTAMDGSFSKTDVLTDEYEITVTKPDYSSVILPAKYVVESVKNTVVPDITLNSIYGIISGAVSFADGSVPEKILVSIEDSNGIAINTTSTSSTGMFSFKVVPGTYLVKASAVGYGESSQALTVVAGNSYTVRLEALSSMYGIVNGTVLDEKNDAMSGAIVLFTGSDGIGTTTSTGPDGAFSSKLVADTYSVTVSKAGYVSQYFNVILSPNMTYPLDSIKMMRGSSGIYGRVTLSGESNHSGVTVTATSSSNSERIYSTTTNEDGEYSFTGIEEGEYLIKMQKTGFVSDMSQTISSVAGVISQVPAVTLKNTNSTISGTVVLEGTGNYAGTMILLASSDSSISYNTTTLQSGKYTITGVKPGNYTLTISKSGYEIQVISDVFVESSATKTIDPINLNIAFASITGKVQLELRDDYAGAQVTATNLSNPSIIFSAITNSVGDYSFAEMPTGEYRLVITASNYVTETLRTIEVLDSITANAGITEMKIAKGIISGLAKLEGYSDHSGIAVSLLGTEYTTITESDGSYSFLVPSGNYPGGIRFEHEDYETISHASTVTVLTNSTYAIPDKELSAINVPYILGNVSIYGVTDGKYDGIVVKIAELPDFSMVTDVDGNWFFEHVPVGTYTFEFLRENIRKVTKIVDVKAAPSIHVEDLELIPDSVTFTGHISLDSVTDYSGVTVRITTPDSVELRTVTNAAGYFYISNIIASRSHTVFFEKEGWDTQSIDIEANAYEPLSIVDFTEDHITLVDTNSPVLTGMSATIGRSTAQGREICLYIYGSDKGSGIKYIQGNTSSSFEGVEKQEFYNPFILTIPEELGAKVINVRVEDASGNVSNVVTSNIVITNDKTELNGPLSEDKLHLTKENSPYLMTGNVLIESGKTLVIDPGVEIQINGNYYIQVEGSLSAGGTENDRIKIYGIDSGTNNWSGIKFLSSSSNVLSYADVSGLKNGITGYCDIDHCLLTANGWAIGSSSSSRLTGNISNSTINGSVSASSRMLNDNVIVGSTIDLSNIIAILDNNITGSVTVSSSVIDGNEFFGSKLATSGSILLNNVISSTSVSSFSDWQRYITFNGSRMTIGYSGSSSVPSILSEIVFNNCTFSKFAATVNESNFVNCGAISISTDRKTEVEFDLTGNYWGDLNTVEVRAKGEDQNLSFITDYHDDFNLAKVNYGGFKESSIPNIGYQGDGYGREELSTVEYSIGDTGPAGGIIFYDRGFYSDGWRYLEAAPSDIGSYVFGYYRPDGINERVVRDSVCLIGSGRINTEMLVKHMDIDEKAFSSSSGGSVSEYAAKKCLDYELGGYSDWFLPSRDELNLMYQNLCKNGVGSFKSSNYWSSSEYSGASTFAWSQSFNLGGQGYNFRQYKYEVRAVRAF